MKFRNHILFYLNGERHEVSSEHAGLMLSDYLRYQKQLTGTKIVCAEGDCGACTILRLYPSQRSQLFLPINSCITTLAQMDGSSLISVDALAKLDLDDQGGIPHERAGYTPVQKAMMTCHGSQCGFCTPGFVMALTGLVEKKLASSATNISSQEAKNSLTGNLCRCTGYQPIIEAACSIPIQECDSVLKNFYSAKQKKDLLQSQALSISLRTETFEFFAPLHLKDAVTYLKKNKDARLIGAGTDLGVVHNKRKLRLNQLLSLHLIKDLYTIKKQKNSRVSVGARVTLSELRTYLKNQIPEFARFLDLFASPQIKNIASLVGNVATASPIGDTPPFLLTMNAEVEGVGPKGKRLIPLESFFISYRKTDLKAGEMITFIHFDIPKKTEELAIYKVSQRKDLDISAVNFAIRLEWTDHKKSQIKNLKLAVGGVAGIPLRLYKTEKVLEGRSPTSENLNEAIQKLHLEITPLSDLRASQAYRHLVTENLLQKFFRERSL